MNGWEHLFHFTQDGNTEIDLEQSGVPYGPGPTNPRNKADASNVKRNAKRSGRDWRPTTTCWHLTYKSKATKEITKEIAGEKKHPAIFPEELVEKCIKVSGLKKGIMFDCFAGTGTSLLVAKKMGLDYFGCDLDEDYGRFGITPEFPEGTYAYFATVDSTQAASAGAFANYKQPVFPYLIGTNYHSTPNKFNFRVTSNQDEFAFGAPLSLIHI